MKVSPQIQSCCVCSPPRTQSRICAFRSSLNLRDCSFLFSSNPRIVSSGFQEFSRFNLRCSSTGDSGENESKTILDAFFLGKAVAEALNERVESAVGEFLSTIGRLQAEQQKQVQEFQDDVFERAKRAREQAAKEALGEQRLIPNSGATEEISQQNPVAGEQRLIPNSGATEEISQQNPVTADSSSEASDSSSYQVTPNED